MQARASALTCLLVSGCAISVAPALDASDGGAVEACAVRWLDAPISRPWYYPGPRPVFTRDEDGFLLVRPATLPDVCEDEPCQLTVERISATGESAERAAPLPHLAQLFAESDASGHGYWALADAVANGSGRISALSVTWGRGLSDDVDTLALDPERGLGAVAFDDEGLWLVTHDWLPETTVGEGYSYPTRPRIERLVGSSLVAQPLVDPTDTYFQAPSLMLTPSGPWLTMSSIFAWSTLRAVGPAFSGSIAVGGGSHTAYDAVTISDGSLVVARYDDEAHRVHAIRVAPDGTTTAHLELAVSGPTLSIAYAREQGELVLLHRGEAGVATITALDEGLAVLGTATVPGPYVLAPGALLEVAAAESGTWAVLVGSAQPTAAGPTRQSIDVLRFRVCE